MKLTEFSTIRSISKLIPLEPLTVGMIVFLGLLAALLEGAGLYLFLPIFNSLNGRAAQDTFSPFPGFIRDAMEEVPTEWLVPVLVSIVMVSIVLKNVVAFFNAALFAKVNCKAGDKLRTDLYASILSASLGYVDDQKTGRISSAMLSETWRVVEAQGVVYRIIVQSCAAFVLFFVLVFVSWQATLLVLPVSLLILASMQVVTRFNQKIGAEAVAANSRFIKKFWETMEGLPTIRNFGTADYELRGFSTVSSNIRKVFLKLQLIGSLNGPIFEILAVTALAGWLFALIYFGVDLTNAAVFVLIISRLQPRLRFLAESRASILQYSSSVDELEQVGVDCRGSALPSGQLVAPDSFSRIDLKDLSLVYEKRQSMALNNVSLCIEKDTTIALVGPSGAGKSSLISLLCRHRDPTAGQILIDGVDLRSLDVDSWRQRIGIVPQTVHLFDTTIGENIAYGLGEYDHDRVLEASRLAYCDEFIQKLPSGFQTEVGEKGVRLSGGQRQRIALARALIRRPEILILDEATNALDGESEQAIKESLSGLSRQLTMVIIAHRMATIQSADKIVVLFGGEVLEQGTPGELKAQGGYFSKMESLQLGSG